MYELPETARQSLRTLMPPLPPPHPSSRASGKSPARHDAAEAAQRLADALRAGGRVAMLLDYDGTLREFEPDPAAAMLTPAVRALLDALAAEPRIDVTLISGRTPEDLESFFPGYPFCLIAEHGAVIRRPGSREWERLDRHTDYMWRDELLGLFRAYAQSTPGSLVEEKRTSLVWHYRRADPQDGAAKALRLIDELAPFAANRSVVVRHGKKIVEVTAAEVNKGAAIRQLLNCRTAPYGLVLIAGDDLTDESMFRLGLPNLVTIKVGEGDTFARYRLRAPEDLRRLLLAAAAPPPATGANHE